jgi:hypothetical protein
MPMCNSEGKVNLSTLGDLSLPLLQTFIAHDVMSDQYLPHTVEYTKDHTSKQFCASLSAGFGSSL